MPGACNLPLAGLLVNKVLICKCGYKKTFLVSRGSFLRTLSKNNPYCSIRIEEIPRFARNDSSIGAIGGVERGSGRATSTLKSFTPIALSFRTL